MIGWYIGLMGVFICVVGEIYFIKSLVNMEGELKKSIFYLVLASSFYILFAGVVVVFGLLQYEVNKIWWEIVPVLFAISSVVFVFGSYKLVKILSEVKRR